MEKLELFYPIRPFIVNQAFGACRPDVCDFYKKIGLDGHNGIDCFALRGQYVRAAHDGLVTFAGEDGSAGYGVVIRTHDKRLDSDGNATYFKTIYWHLQSDGVLVRAGQSVKVGDPIGLADSTGFSTGDHLHFGLKPVYPGEEDWAWYNREQDNGYRGAINPAGYFNGVYAEFAQGLISKFQLLITLLQRMVESLRK